jgi:hypothetical protein
VKCIKARRRGNLFLSFFQPSIEPPNQVHELFFLFSAGDPFNRLYGCGGEAAEPEKMD